MKMFTSLWVTLFILVCSFQTTIPAAYLQSGSAGGYTNPVNMLSNTVTFKSPFSWTPSVTAHPFRLQYTSSFSLSNGYTEIISAVVISANKTSTVIGLNMSYPSNSNTYLPVQWVAAQGHLLQSFAIQQFTAFTDSTGLPASYQVPFDLDVNTLYFTNDTANVFVATTISGFSRNYTTDPSNAGKLTTMTAVAPGPVTNGDLFYEWDLAVTSLNNGPIFQSGMLNFAAKVIAVNWLSFNLLLIRKPKTGELINMELKYLSYTFTGESATINALPLTSITSLTISAGTFSNSFWGFSQWGLENRSAGLPSSNFLFGTYNPSLSQIKMMLSGDIFYGKVRYLYVFFGTMCSDNCLTCSTTKSGGCITPVAQGSCPAIQYALDQGCQSCPSGCATCSNSTHCNTCQTGFYQYYAQCPPCPSGCATCVDSSTCSSCQTGVNRISSPNPRCPCTQGFYEDSGLACKSCPNGCLQCITAGVCTACDVKSNRVVTPSPVCPCKVGYVESNEAICVSSSLSAISVGDIMNMCVDVMVFAGIIGLLVYFLKKTAAPNQTEIAPTSPRREMQTMTTKPNKGNPMTAQHNYTENSMIESLQESSSMPIKPQDRLMSTSKEVEEQPNAQEAEGDQQTYLFPDILKKARPKHRRQSFEEEIFVIDIGNNKDVEPNKGDVNI